MPSAKLGVPSLPRLATVFSSMKTRRDLLRTGSAASLPLLLSSRVQAQDPDKQDSSPIKIGLIGCGGRGTGAAVQALQADPGVILWSVADAFPEALPRALNHLSRFEKRIQAPPARQFSGLDSFQQLIDSGVDVVLLGTPPAFRPQHLQAAIEAGKHVFAEKPVAVDMHGVHSVIQSARLAERKGLSIQHGFCWRFHPGTREAFGKVLTGDFGKVISIYGTYLANPVKPLSEKSSGMSSLEWQIRNWVNFDWLGGGPLVEQCIHTVDKVAWAMGDIEPVAVVATGGRLQKEDASNIFDHYQVAYEYPNGLIAHVGQRQLLGCHQEVIDRIHCTDAILHAPGRCFAKDHSGKTIWRSRPKKGVEQNMYQVCHNEFFSVLRRGGVVNSGEFMARSTALGLFGREAAHTGQRLTWEDFWNSKQDLAPEMTALDQDFPVPPIPTPGV